MLKINRKVEYALMALKYIQLKGKDHLVTAREICDEFHTPFDTTAKVLQIMNSYGILKSSKGIHGGYQLARTMSSLNYLELSELIEGKSMIMDCEAMNCDLLGNCNITGPIKKLNHHLEQFFKNLSIEQLLEEQKERSYEL
jgi:Rrf2 family protein